MDEGKKELAYVTREECKSYLRLHQAIETTQKLQNRLYEKISEGLTQGIMFSIFTGGAAVYTGVSMYNGEGGIFQAVFTGLLGIMAGLTFHKREKLKNTLKETNATMDEFKNSPKYKPLEKILNQIY